MEKRIKKERVKKKTTAFSIILQNDGVIPYLLSLIAAMACTAIQNVKANTKI